MSLQQSLERSEKTVAGYLGLLVFYNGDGTPPCEKVLTLAFTVPGSRVVRVCDWLFMKVLLRNPELASATIIHEELHSLGLGENPPASQEITDQVLLRCGR